MRKVPLGKRQSSVLMRWLGPRRSMAIAVLISFWFEAGMRDLLPCKSAKTMPLRSATVMLQTPDSAPVAATTAF